MARLPEAARKGQNTAESPIGRLFVSDSAVSSESGNEDLINGLQLALAALPLPIPSSIELHTALLTVGRYDQGEVRELSGLPAWLDFLRDPYEADQPIDDADVPRPEDARLTRLIANAIAHVTDHPEPPEDPTDALMRIGPGVSLYFDPKAAPPFDRFEALCDTTPAFRRAIDHKRPDLPDQAIETYDAALADHAVADGWSDQEVFDLLIYHHTKWLENPMPDQSIIEAARGNAGVCSEESRPAPPAAPVELSPSIAVIRRALGIAVSRVRKLGRKRGVFELILENGDVVELGTASALQSHREVQAAIMDAVGKTIPPLKGELWRKVIDAVLAAATVEETENDPAQETLHWLRLAKFHTVCITLDREAPADIAKELRNGAVHPLYLGRDEMFVCMPALIRYVHVNCGVRPTWPEMGLRLRKIGFRPEQLQARDHSGTVKARLWTSPRGFTLDA